MPFFIVTTVKTSNLTTVMWVKAGAVKQCVWLNRKSVLLGHVKLLQLRLVQRAVFEKL
jgi:hypothetical protein